MGGRWGRKRRAAMADMKEFSMLEVLEHASRQDFWMVIDGKVYDVTSFLLDHPGGDDLLLQTLGRDAHREFEDVGHSGDARQKLEELFVGKLRDPTPEESEKMAELEKAGKKVGPVASANSPVQTALKFLFPVLILVIALVVRKYVS
ncbi:Cytochrome B5 isoform D [Porphyridium purpureum]|uniref:Cytochrome B5 isoform D n=1 Tax=Porphyridium purpureum TaxID=35688 RepID=A0A5J4Z7Y1_PORPP|nr:Cytochrome B5 isoform D [Porphyridium purpureum]|eukprot:POR1751..scf295_1